MPPWNFQREGNHEIHETHEKWQYIKYIYVTMRLIYSRRLVGRANGERGGPPPLVTGLSKFFRVFRVFRGSIFLSSCIHSARPSSTGEKSVLYKLVRAVVS